MKVKVKLLSHVRLFLTPWAVAYQVSPSMGFSSENTGVGCHFLLQELFPTQGLNPGLPHCRQMLYRLSHQGSHTHTHTHTHTHNGFNLDLTVLVVFFSLSLNFPVKSWWSVPQSAVQQQYIYILFNTLFHYGSSQDVEYCSLCYIVVACCLSILCIIVCIC